MSIETEITRIKTNIASAYTKAEEKGATLPEVQNSANLPATIESITGGGEEWQPQPDWWDIDKILEEDTEDYPAKMICLLNDIHSTQTFYQYTNWTKMVTSDGIEYTNQNKSFTHTWDSSKDKECSQGYKTRYVIFYYSNDFQYRNLNLGASIMYIIFKNINVKIPSTNIGSWSPLANCSNCQYVKFKNCTFSGSNFSFANMSKLLGIEGYNSINNTISDYMYQNCISLSKIDDYPQSPTSMNNTFSSSLFKEIKYIDTSNVTNFNNCFNLCHCEIIENLDFNSATNISNMFNGTGNVISINNVSNIKITGLNFNQASSLNHDTLIRILNALYDYSDGDTHTITLGATNLAKLTEEELAIGTNKNWTIS